VIASARDGRCVIEVLDQALLMSEHGRGLKIIDAVVDDLYMTGNGPAGTTVHFEKSLHWKPGALAEELFAAGSR
jgi:hypothetical protein